MLTAYGATVVTFMMVMYALERRGAVFVLGFAVGCALSASYGFLSGTWPFGAVESIWCLVALDRFRKRARATPGGASPPDQSSRPGSSSQIHS